MEGVKVTRSEEITPHILRHTFISHLLVYGKQDLLTVSKLAGHSSIKTTQIYLHLVGGDSLKIEAVNSLPDYGKNLKSGPQTDPKNDDFQK